MFIIYEKQFFSIACVESAAGIILSGDIIPLIHSIKDIFICPENR